MFPPMSEQERFRRDTNTGRSFVIKARRDPNTFATHGDAAQAPQPDDEAVQVLDNTCRRPYPETSGVHLTHNQIRRSPVSPLHDIMQRIITAVVDRIMEAKINLEMSRVAEKATMGLLTSGLAAAG